MSQFFKSNSLKKKSLAFFLIVFLILGLGFNVFFVKNSLAIHCTCHIVSDTSPTNLINKAANIASKAFNSITSKSTTAILAIKTWERANLFLTEYLKTKLINALTNETLKFIQGDNDGQVKFVTDLESYLFGEKNFEGLENIVKAETGSLICPINRPAFDAGLRMVSLQPIRESQCIDLNSLTNKNNVLGALDQVLANPIQNMPYLAAWTAIDAYDQEVAKKEEEQTLKYLANQGYVSQTKKTDKCLLYDSQGNCVKWQELITTPGRVFSDMIQNTADAHIKRIVNAQNFQQLAALIASSFIDKIVSAGENGLLGMSSVEESAPSSYFSQAGGATGSGENSVYDWLNWKYQSKALIKDQILLSLQSLKDCYSQKGDTLMISPVEDTISQYQDKLAELDAAISKVEADLTKYDSSVDGSVSEAEQEYNQLNEEYNQYQNMVYTCQSAEPGETVTSWFNYKQKSYNLITNQIIPTLNDLKDCETNNGLGTSATESKISKYSSLAQSIKEAIDRVSSDPMSYDPAQDGTAKSAKKEYEGLKDDLSSIQSSLQSCQNFGNFSAF